MSEPKDKQLLTADDAEAILTMDDLATAEVYVPEWKKTVRLRQVTGAESIELATAKTDGMLRIVAMSVVDAHGNRIFKDHERLRGKSAGALGLIQNEALKLNGFSATVQAAAVAAAAAKNA